MPPPFLICERFKALSNIDKSNKPFYYPYFIIAIVAIPILGLISRLVIEKGLPNDAIGYLQIPVIVIVLYFIFNKLPWDYVTNRFTASITVAVLFIFLLHLTWGVREDIRDVKDGKYKNSYTISFEDSYKEYSDHIFLLSNSNYVFLIDSESKEMSVIPKGSIKTIFTKHNERYDWLLK